MKHGAILAALALCLGTTSAHGISPQPEPFLEHHARAVAANIYGAFSIRFTDERRTFHAREPIEIELVYERHARFTRDPVDGPGAISLVRAQFDRPVAVPLQVIDSKFDPQIPSGVPGCLTQAPIVVRRTLNHVYRFDIPGRYRMFLQSRQVTPQFETSNILEFEILRDGTWERDALTRAARTLGESPLDRRAAADAFRTLRTLATNDATAILARYYQRGDEHLETADVEYGLFANPDRGFVADVLAREVRKPERTFGRWFMPTLARLELARRHPEGPPFSHDEYMKLIRQFAVSRARALNRVPSRLAGEMRRELMEYPADLEHFVRGVVTPALRDYPQEATAAFRSLSAEAQRSRLHGSWRRFAHSVFLPLLRSLYRSPAEASDAVRDIALRRLFELAPDEARTAMRAELRRDQPRVSMDTLAMLPDRAFPEYERRWAELLERGPAEQDRRLAAQRIERFGTEGIAASIRRFYERHDGSLSCGTRAALLAYLVRVDPERGRQELAKATTGFTWDRTCSGGVLEDTADLEWSPAVEGAALDVLVHEDPDVVGSVSRALSQHGSPSVREALERRLEQVQSAIHDRRDLVNPSREKIDALQVAEWDLASALTGARSWTLTPEERERFAARCSDGRACNGNFTVDRRSDPAIRLIAPRPRIGYERHLEFFIDGYSGRSLEDLDRKLWQFQPGTRIYWDDWPYDGRDSLDRWTWAERDELFERLRRKAARYGVILLRDRTLRLDPPRLQFGPRVDLRSGDAPNLLFPGPQGCR